jgi:hypothetical protein
MNKSCNNLVQIPYSDMSTWSQYNQTLFFNTFSFAGTVTVVICGGRKWNLCSPSISPLSNLSLRSCVDGLKIYGMSILFGGSSLVGESLPLTSVQVICSFRLSKYSSKPLDALLRREVHGDPETLVALIARRVGMLGRRWCSTIHESR